jgi:hypothetical protein
LGAFTAPLPGAQLVPGVVLPTLPALPAAPGAFMRVFSAPAPLAPGSPPLGHMPAFAPPPLVAIGGGGGAMDVDAAAVFGGGGERYSDNGGEAGGGDFLSPSSRCLLSPDAMDALAVIEGQPRHRFA